MLLRGMCLSVALLVAACSPAPLPPAEYPPLVDEAPAAEAAPIRLTLIATNDVHGHIERLPFVAGFVNNVRAAREADGGGMLLISGGDMWQGTLASNMTEGAAMVQAFNAMGYDAAAVGNHEFDYGPLGEATTPQNENDERRGALLARASEANFGILSANILDAESGEPVQWEGIAPTMLIERAGVKVGIIGLSTEETPETTISANVDDIRIAPLAETAATEARRLREQGATVVIVTAHAGAHCESFEDPEDLSSCDLEEEIVQVAQAIPEGLVDAIVGGHTHRAIAHRVNGIPVLEQYSYGYAFGRVDFEIDPETGEVNSAQIFAPQEVCQDREVGIDDCEPGEYEGRPVVADEATMAVARPAMEAAAARLNEELGVTVTERFTRSRSGESPLGNLLADAMLASRPNADLAILNGGGVRADFPAGALTYGSLYETFPFDNRYAEIRLTGLELRSIVEANLAGGGGTLIFAGIRVEAQCRGSELRVVLKDSRGRRIRDNQTLLAVTSDYLALTPSFRGLPEENVNIEGGAPIREAIAEYFRQRGGEIAPGEFHNQSRPRFDLPSERPVRCQ